MGIVELRSEVDTRELQALIPEIVAFGRRTLREQCVTSGALIAMRTQKATPAVGIGEIDAELAVVKRVSGPRTNFGKKAGLGGLPWTEGMEIALQRTNPTSPFSQLTGYRWPLAYPGGLRGVERWRFFVDAADRMESARHSSTHFLQHGWGPSIKTFLTDPAYYAGRSKMQVSAQAQINPLNTLGSNELGRGTVTQSGDVCVVTGENAVGQDGNPVLDAKHRAALIKYGLTPLQEEIDAESRALTGKIQEYIDRGMSREFARV